MLYLVIGFVAVCNLSALCRELRAWIAVAEADSDSASASWTAVEVSACAVLRDPQPVFAVRGLPLTELTTFELCVKLREADWEWRLWLPKGARPKKALPIPDGYLTGADRVWFSTAAQASRSYLFALLTAEDLNSWRYVGYWMVVRSFFFCPHYAGFARLRGRVFDP